MPQVLHAFFCLWFCAAAAIVPVFASTEKYDLTWGGQPRRKAPPRPDIVPSLDLSPLTKPSVRSSRATALLKDAQECEEILSNLKWQDPRTMEILAPLYERAVKGMGRKNRDDYVRIAARTMLRILREPDTHFPIVLHHTPCDRIYCTYLAYPLAELTAEPELQAQARIILVKNMPKEDLYLGGALASKGALLMEAYTLFPSHKKAAKAKVLLSLLKDWPHEPLHLEGHLFTRQDCVETLYRLTLAKHFPLDLKIRVYRDLGKHWGQTPGFRVAGRVIDRNVLRKKGYALAHSLKALRAERACDDPISPDITPRLPFLDPGPVAPPEPSMLPLPTFMSKAKGLPPTSQERLAPHPVAQKESF
ncbi:MAG: hypothetical protein C0514_01015 [Candidatus Puniceispirillum sp.]|nr:hypothetical protein [Candidatus Puniceispirillum sp.]